MIKNIAIVGAGGFGLAISKLLCSYKKFNLVLWSALEEEIYNLKKYKENKRLLPNILINTDEIFLTNDVKDLKNAEIIIFAVASNFIRQVAKKIAPILKKDVIIVNASKGMEEKSFKRLSEVIYEETKIENIVVLSGPSHAEEIAKLMPTTIVAACQNIHLAKKVQEILNSSYFRVYVNEDVVGVEIAAALKNIIALAVGICEGFKLGDNAKAALITRGLAEIAKLGIFLGAKKETFAGLSGLGDLIVTCTSLHSRNKRAGILIGEGISVEKALKTVNKTVEGYYATKTVYELARKEKISMPITEELYEILYENKDIGSSIKTLMNRTAKNENKIIWV